MADFKRSLAVVIGINEYQDYQKLQTARYDAERLVEILAIDHNYNYVILATDDSYKEYLNGQELPVKNKYQPTLNGLLNLLDKRLPQINPTQEDRLLFYFAGHGIPDDSDEGPKGYLVPLDADSKKRDSLLPMQELYRACCKKREPFAINTFRGLESGADTHVSGKIRQNPCTCTRENVPKT